MKTSSTTNLGYVCIILALGCIPSTLCALTTITVSSATPSLAENSPGGTNVLTGITADDVVTVWSLTGTDAASFDITPTATASASLTVTVKTKTATSLDFETKASYTFTISATDGTDTVTQAITLSVTNVNEAPAFTASAAVKLTSPATSSTAVATVLATDVDSGDVVTHSLSGATSVFEIAASTGVISIKSGVSLSTNGQQYFLTIKAADNDATPLTGTTYVAVCVGTCDESCISGNNGASALSSVSLFGVVLVAAIVRYFS